jgi:hypothetical protein
LVQKIDHIVNIIEEKENIPSDFAYKHFSTSKIYRSLQKPESLLCTESAEFITDEYFRENGS